MSLYGQVAITPTGGDASGKGGSVAFSTGQTVYSTRIGTNVSVAEGVQQPFEISVITGIDAAKDVTLNYSVYPNPTTDFLTLKVENDDHNRLLYQLFDTHGVLVMSKMLEGTETSISMSHLTSAIYILKVKKNGQWIKSFKIIKNSNYEKGLFLLCHPIGKWFCVFTIARRNELSGCCQKQQQSISY